MTESNAAPPSARALLRERDYLFFWGARWSGNLATQIQSVAMGWQIYDIARRTLPVEQAALVMGFLGLAIFLPLLMLALPAGETADRYDRRKIMILAYTGEALSVAVLAFASWRGFISVPIMLGAAFAFGASRAFLNPTNSALGPMLVPRALLPRAIAWNSLAGQSSSIFGPAIAGLLVAQSTTLAYVVSIALYVTAQLSLSAIRRNTRPERQPGSRVALIKEGLAYVWGNKVVFGAISLDLVAVLLGGATALLPVFARDVLHADAQAFGLLRASPAAGATIVGLYLAARPIHRRAGVTMFAGVAVFGLATVVFGLSRSLWLSSAALAVVGGADMLSVFVRQTLVQLVTPDVMRGRVAAVSSLFIGASNELGEFESGVAARLLGPVGAALFGGVGAILATGLWARMFPALRRTDRLE